MESKYLYIKGEYVHTNQKLWEKIRELIDDSKNTNGDATIRLLSDLYRNGHLKEFCSQKEYVNGKENPNCIVTFDDNLRGDIKLANHVAARLKGDDNYAPFSHGIHKHFTIHSVSISRKEEQEVPIWSIPFTPKEKNESVSVFLLNGFRQHKNSIKDAYVNLTYSIDNKESLNEQIPVSIGSHSEILNLSKIKDEMEVSIKIKESDLDPCKDINILIGDDGCYGKIILRAPQINVPIRYESKTIEYPMMRIFRGKHYFYIGVWPFEYDNTEEWKPNITPYNFLYDEYYAKRDMNFYIIPNTDAFNIRVLQKEFLDKFEVLDYSLFDIQDSWDCGLDIPVKREWEYVACIDGSQNPETIILQKNDDETYCLCCKELEKRFQPNVYGVYAMLGNLFEVSKDGTNICYMGGDLLNHEIKATYLSNADRVPFFCLRFVVHKMAYTNDEFEDEPSDLFNGEPDFIDHSILYT